MEKISAPIVRPTTRYADKSERHESEAAPPRPPHPAPPLKGYDCPICKDKKWVYKDVPMNDPRFGQAFRCPCQSEVDKARRTAWLLSIDGLTPTERTLRFEQLWVHPGNQMAIETVERALVARRGMVTLLGPPGTGKTRLLCCAVNAARQVNIPAVYTTLTDLLDYLRSAYDPSRVQPLNFDARWDLLVTAELLALDELDEFSATAWAMERFQRLIDERWRNMDKRLTLLASNSRLSVFPAKVASRLNDGRASVVALGGRDLRPLHEWDATES